MGTEYKRRLLILPAMLLAGFALLNLACKRPGKVLTPIVHDASLRIARAAKDMPHGEEAALKTLERDIADLDEKILEIQRLSTDLGAKNTAPAEAYTRACQSLIHAESSKLKAKRSIRRLTAGIERVRQTASFGDAMKDLVDATIKTQKESLAFKEQALKQAGSDGLKALDEIAAAREQLRGTIKEEALVDPEVLRNLEVSYLKLGAPAP